MTYSRIRMSPTRMPNSSQMAEKMKSLSATGTMSGLPRPRPMPVRPPEAMEISD